MAKGTMATHKLSKHEMKLVDGCRWLMAAGFPQYVQMYRDNRFPISSENVKRDHEFLDSECLQALTRRLNVLKKLAEMNVNFPRSKSSLAVEDPANTEIYALSDHWRFDQLSQQWLWTASTSSNQLPRFHSTSPTAVESSQNGRHRNGIPIRNQSESVRHDSDALCESPKCLNSCVFLEECSNCPLTSGYASNSSPQLSAGSVSSRRSKADSSDSYKPESISPPCNDSVWTVKRNGSSVGFDKSGLVHSINIATTMSSSVCSVESKSNGVRNECVSQETISWSDRLKQGHSKSYLSSRNPSNETISFSDDAKVVVRRRHSFYDNLSPNELNSITPDLQSELDLILDELYYNSESLDESANGLNVKQQDKEHSMTDVQNRKSSTLPVGLSLAAFGDSTTLEKPTRPPSSFRSHHASISQRPMGRDWCNGVVKYQRPVLNGRHGSVEDRDEVFLSAYSEKLQNQGLVATIKSFSISTCDSSVEWNECVAVPGADEWRKLNRLHAKQLTALRKLSTLKLTALIDQHCAAAARCDVACLIASRSTPCKSFHDANDTDTKVFGVALCDLLERDGCSVSRDIAHAIRHLRTVAMDASGLFRKSGIKSRIQQLQDQIDSGAAVDLCSFDLYDVADALKRYYRELPECLLTDVLSPLFLTIFLAMPAKVWLTAVHRAVILLPDAHRQAIQVLLEFLYDISERSAENQMTASNLAVCFLPSFFRPPNLPSAGSAMGSESPLQAKRSDGDSGGQTKLWDYKAALACVKYLIEHGKTIFQVPDDCWKFVEMSSFVGLQDLRQRVSSVNDDLTRAHANSYIQFCLDMTLKEHTDWILKSDSSDFTLWVKDICDNECLPMWRCSVKIRAESWRVLSLIRNERHLWNKKLIRWHVVDEPSENCDVIHSVVNIGGNEADELKEFCEFRCWRSDLPRGACALVCTSTLHPAVHAPPCTARATVFASHWLVEPCGPGQSRVEHVSRVDLRGHTVDWYRAAYGQLIVDDVTRLRDCFSHHHLAF